MDVPSQLIQWDKDNLYNKWCWNNWTVMGNKINPEPSFTQYTNNNSKWIVDQSVRVKTDNNKQTKQKEHIGEK